MSDRVTANYFNSVMVNTENGIQLENGIRLRKQNFTEKVILHH